MTHRHPHYVGKQLAKKPIKIDEGSTMTALTIDERTIAILEQVAGRLVYADEVTGDYASCLPELLDELAARGLRIVEDGDIGRTISKGWCVAAAGAEGEQEITAGLPDTISMSEDRCEHCSGAGFHESPDGNYHRRCVHCNDDDGLDQVPTRLDQVSTDTIPVPAGVWKQMVAALEALIEERYSLGARNPMDMGREALAAARAVQGDAL